MVTCLTPLYWPDMATSSSEPCTGVPIPPPRVISMLLWPEQNHTSPMRTFDAVTVSEPLRALTVWGLKVAAGVLTVATHSPFALALAEPDAPQEVLTLTLAPGDAYPHIFTEVFCWRTMLSPIMPENLRLAAFSVTQRHNTARVKSFFILNVKLVISVLYPQN